MRNEQSNIIRVNFFKIYTSTPCDSPFLQLYIVSDSSYFTYCYRPT